MKLSKVVLAAFLITGCSSELPHEAPFDALSPFDKQAKGQVTGNIRLEGESDHSQVTVQLQSLERTYSVDTAADGAVKLTGVVPGTYELSVRTRYFQPFSDTVQVALGEELNLGSRELPLNRAAVFGSALLEKAGNVMSGGVMVTLAKTGSIRSSADSAGAPAFKRAAAETTAETYTTISSAAGQYQFSDIPAGRYDVRAAGGEGEEATVAQVTVTGEGNVRLDDIVLRPLTGFFEIVGQANSGDSSAYTTVPTVQLKLTAANAQKMKIAESSDGSAGSCNLAGATEQTYAGLVNFTFVHGTGRKLVCVQYIDLEGKETPPIYGTIIYDNAAPSPVNVLPITNNGFSKTQNVLANLSAIDDLSGVAAFTLETSPAAALTAVKQPFQSTIQINFPGAGTQTTYVRVFDAAGNASDAVEVSVVVDTAAPMVSSASVETLTGTAIAHNDTTRESRVVLRSVVSDLTPLDMQVTTTGSFAGLGWEPYSAGKIIDLTAASSTVAARVRDSAGNVVELLSGVTVNLDNQAPTATFTLDSGSPTNNLTVSYTVGSSESGDMQVSADVGFAGASWVPVGAGTIVLSPGDGVRSIYARTRDAAGNTSDIKTLQVVVDRTPPQNAGFTITSGEVTNSRLVNLAFSGVDIEAVRVAEDACAGSYATHGGTGSLNLASAGDGVKTVAVQFRDAVGNETACFTKTVTLDETAPVVNSFLINNNAAAVTTRSVTLTIDTDADEMQVSESSAFSGASWQPVTSTVNFTLSAGEGSKTVYARFRDAARNPAGPVQDSILVDTVAPVFHAVSGPAAASVTTVTLSLSASGADLMRLSENADFSGADWAPFLAGPTFYLGNTQGAHTIYVQLADTAGNESTVRTHSVSLDSIGPDTPIVSVVGGQYTKVPGITVQTLVDGAAEIRIGQQADVSDGTWTPFTQLKAHTLVGGEGAHTIYVQVRDAAQNASAIASATVTLDSTPPVVNMRADDGLGNLLTETNSTRYYMRLWVTDATDAQVQFASSNSFSGVPFEAVSTLRTWDVIAPTASGGASYNTYVKVSDAAGNSTTVGPITVLVDTVGPTAPALSFAASTVSSPTVTATFSAVNADYVEISEDISFLSPTVLTYRTSESWMFTNTDDGVKNLYVRFADNLGNYSAVAVASVTLDQTAPENTAFSIAQASPTRQSTLNLSLSAIGATQMSVSENSCASSWEAYAQTKAHILSNTAEGNKTVAVRFRDAVGNVSPCLTQTVYFDNTPPTLNAPAIALNYGAASTSSGTVTVVFDVINATEVKVSEDSSLADAAWLPYTATRTFTLSAGNGTKTVYAIFRDAADNQTSIVNDTIVLDTTPISVPFVTIQADVTSSTNVLVNFAASNIDEMWYSEQSDFSTGAWEPYVGTKSVNFSAGDGTKTLYAKFRKSSGAESVVASDSYILDTAAPILPSVRVNNGASVVSSSIVTLNLSAVDETSGLAYYQINTVNDFSTAANRTYQLNDLYTLAGGDGAKNIWVRYADRARNFGAPVSTTIMLDTSAPLVNAVAVKQLDGNAISSGATVRENRVVLSSDVSDLTTLEIQVSTNGTYVGAAWEPYSPNKVIDLIGASTTIQARVRDQAGLITDLVTGFTVNLDNTAPVVSFVRTSSSPANSLVVTFALSANETVEFQIAEDPNFASASWVTPAPADHTLSAGEGFRTLYARARDAAGNLSETKSITVTLDTVAPLVSKVSIDEGAYSATRSIQLTLFATGADTMKLAESSDLTAVSAQPYATITAFDLSDSDGAKTVYVQFQDVAGNTSATYPLAVTLDRAAPGVPTVMLNGGASWANNRLVSVGVTADASAIEMQVSEDPLFGNAAWQPFNGSFSHTLQSVNDGNKQLLVRLRDRAGNVSVAGTANIQLDTEAPADAFLSKAAHPFDYANNTTVLMNLGASAADYMRVSTDGTFDTETWRAMAATTSVTVSATDGLKTVYAQFRDQANNLSQIVQASFFLDTQAPEAGTLAFAQGSYTNQRDVFLQLNASGADFYQISTTTANLAVQPRQPMQPGRPVTLADSDGTHTYYVRFLDRAENVSAVASASILLDRAAPVVGGTPIVLNNGDAYTQQSFVTVTLDVAGATEMQMRNQPFFDNGGWEPVTTSTTWFLENGDGPKTVWVRFRDAAGNVTPAYSDSIHLDQRAPDVSRVVLNDGRDYTNSLTLTLRSEARDVTEMRYGTDASFSTGSGWVAFQENQSVVVAAGDGVKTIYAQFRDAALNTSAIFSDSITLDQTEPESPSLSINSGAAFTREPSGQVQLTLSASDELAGIAGMQLSNVSAAFPSAVSLPYAPSRNWNIDTLSDGTKTVWVRFYDRAGNFSTAVSDTIVLDRAAPAGASVVINGNAVYATTNIVTLALTASDANGVSEMILSTNPGFGDGFWQPFTSSSTFVLPAMDGNRFVHVKFRDAAGNESAPVSDDIQLDTLAPQFDNISVPSVTSNHIVSVQLFAPPAPNATEMRLSEDSLFTGADWVAFSNSTTFTVSAGDGSKTIYAQLRDAAGHTSVVRSATVTYDTTGPDVPAVRIRQGTYISNAAVDVEIFADGATALLISQWAPMTDATPQPFNPVKAFTFTGDDGVKTVYVKVRDGAGNYSSAATAYAVLDRAAPGLGAGAVVINSGAPATNSSFVMLAFNVTGATELQVAEDLGFGGASWAPYSSSRAFTLSQGDGVKTVYARFRDASGNIAGPVNDTIQLDTRAPANPFINIAASVTNVASVTVALSASDADQMKVSLSPDFSGASWEAYAANKTVALSGIDGQKTVYAKFRRSASGHETSVVSDGVLLDRVGPTDAVAELSSAITYVTSTSVSLRLSAVDSLSGVQSVEISESPIFFDKDTLSMRSIAGYTLRIPSEDFHPIYVRYLDKAGNYSNTVTLGVIYDVTPPSGTIQVAGGLERINSQFVTVALSSADPDIQKVRIANDAGAATEFNYSESLIWAIKPIQDTPTEVIVRFVDIAGNASAPYSDIVTYDTAPPVVSSFDLQMEVSTTELTLRWDPSFLPGIASYNWYRHLDGVKTLGGTVASSVTVVTVPAPVAGEEYSVAAVYADGLESALSAAAVENGAFKPNKGILLIDDAAGASSVVTNLKPLLDGAGLTYDTLTVPAGSDGPAAAVLTDYQVVVWSSGEGPTAPTLSAYDRDSLKAYLSAGGNLVYLGSDASADNDTATFLKRWMHTGRVETNLPAIERLYVEAGDIGGPTGTNFPVGPAIQSAEGIFASALSDDFLASGKPLAVRYPQPGTSASYRASWIGLPTNGLYERHVFTFNTELSNLPVTGATLRLPDSTPLQDVEDATVELDLPFDFQFGAIKTDKIWVSSNGNMSFQQPVPGLPYPVFPTTDTATYPGSIIAALWANHEPEGEIFYTASTTEVTIVWQARPITNYTYIDGGGMGVVTATTTAGIILRSDYEFVMISEGADWIGQLPHVEKDFMDESGLGFEAPRDTANNNCCDSDSPAIAVINYRGVIPEAIDWMDRLVRWSAAPAGVNRISPRSFEVVSNVAGATQMRVSVDGALDTEPWIAYNPNLPITGFLSGDGAKTVQVVFIDEAGNVTSTLTDTENLDTDAPRVSTVLLADSSSGSNAYTRNRTVMLQVYGTATNVDFMRVSESPVFVNAGWVPYIESSTFTLSEGDGAKRVYVWLRDPNGNVSAPAVGSIQLDAVAPSTKAAGDTVARQAPLFINTAYTEMSDAVTWSAVASLGTNTQAHLSYLRAVDLNFSFPFYGRGYSRIIIYPSGIVQIGNLTVSEEEPMPMDDEVPEDQVFLAMPNVSPFFTRDLAFSEGHHGVFYAEGPGWSMVRWAAQNSRTLTEVNVALLLYEDGRVKFLYGEGNLDGNAVIGVSRGDRSNFIYSAYNGSSILSSAETLLYTPNPHDDTKVKLYYRYRYPSGPGAWVDSGVQVSSVYDAMAFYPPYGAGTYDFYTVGTDEAGNTEAAPADADLTVIFDDQRPAPPTNIQATSDEDAVFIQWEPTVSPDASGYKIYYGDSADLNGTDASEGNSPIEVPRLNEFRLTNLEPGKPLYVTVTSIDRVGNESGRPSGASFMLPRQVRVVGTLAEGNFDHPQLIDDSLIIREKTSYGASYQWYDMRIPAAPTLVLKTDQASAPIVNGTTLFHQDGHLYDGVRKYDIFNYGTINFLSAGYPLPADIDFIAPEILVASQYGSPFSWESIRTDGVGAIKMFGGQSRGLAVEANRFFVFADEGCYGPPPCWPVKMHAYEYDSGLGMFVAHGPVFAPERTPNTIALSSGYLALGVAEHPPAIQILDVSDPPNVSEVGTYEGSAHTMLRWAGDRLIGMDPSKLSFYDFGDPASLFLESSVAPSIGRPSELLLHGAMGIATGDDGMAAVEFGELLPFDVTGRSASMSGDIKAIVSAGRYIYVSDGTSLNVYRGDNLSEGSPQLVGTYTPFSATNMLVEGKYLFATKGQDLSIFDISSPGSPLLVGQYIDPYSNDGDDDWVNPMAIVGTTLLTSGRAYDISDPLNPVTKYETWQHRFSNFRGDGKYIYSSSWEHGNIQVWSPTDKGLKQLAYYGPITNVEDMALDNNILYAYQVAHPPCCSGGPAWAQLTILDASNPAELKFIQSYPIAPLDGGGAGAARMIAKRGFVYMIERSQFDSTISLIQIDLRDPYAPQIALRITDQNYGSLQPPLAITPDNYVLVKSGSSFEALRITTNVPVFESFAAGTSGVRHVIAGGRYVYYAGGNQIKEVERRAPALKLSLSGSGQVAITKKGLKLQVFDPPGVPATEIVADGTIDLTDPQYDTMQELCSVLDASSRLTCTLDISGAVPSADLIDAYGMRIKPGETPSLRAQKVRRTLNLPGGIVINDLQYSNDRLFAVASEPMPGPAAIEGLYVIDPYTMSASYHDLGEPMQGTQAFSLVLRGTNAYIGSQGKVITYNWAKRTLGAAVNTISPGTEVRHMAVNHDVLFFIDRQFAGMDYESLLQVYGGAFSGNIAFGSQGSRNLGTVVVKGLTALTKDWVAIGTDMGVSLYQRQGGTIVDNFMTSEIYDYVSSVNGKLLLGKGSRLEIIEAVTLPLETTIQRSVFAPGPVKDVAVYGDMLAIAADSGGGVVFRLK